MPDDDRSTPLPAGGVPRPPHTQTDAPPVWVLLGARHGDNQQLLAIAEALGRPYRRIALTFNAASALPQMLIGDSLRSLRRPPPLAPPWPQAVLAAGRRSVPVARWIRRQSGGRARLIHVNRPWAPLDWFDLIVTTPQYGLPPRPNVLANLLPFVSESLVSAAAAGEAAKALARPLTAVLLGGSSRPYAMDAAAADLLARQINGHWRRHGGGLWLVSSPRTPAIVLDLIERRLEAAPLVYRWGQGENPYPALLQTADYLLVTADSANMLAEALASGHPTTPLMLPFRPDWRWRLTALWRRLALRRPAFGRVYRMLSERGLLSSVRDMGNLVEQLRSEAVFEQPERARALIARERAATIEHVRSVIEHR